MCFDVSGRALFTTAGFLSLLTTALVEHLILIFAQLTQALPPSCE
jgi:hypothetical protein